MSNRPAKDTNLVRSFVCPRGKNHGTLENEGVVAALKKQTAALEARYSIEVEADLCDEPEAPLEAKEAVYRIAQEALHNAVKHARASNVQIGMECDSERITLVVSDDGVGFDVRSGFPGHLGLRSMRELKGGTFCTAMRTATTELPKNTAATKVAMLGRVVAGSRQYGCTVDVGPQRGVDGEV